MNPTTVYWTGPTQYVDGTAFGERDHGGYEIEVNGEVAIAVPVAWNADNEYEFPLGSLSGIRVGTNLVRIRTVAMNGEVSEWTPSVAFEYVRVPQMPTNLAVR